MIDREIVRLKRFEGDKGTFILLGGVSLCR